MEICYVFDNYSSFRKYVNNRRGKEHLEENEFEEKFKYIALFKFGKYVGFCIIKYNCDTCWMYHKCSYFNNDKKIHMGRKAKLERIFMIL